ncbi:ATP synthase F1 subunit delta [Psychroflexus maritimus]|uniref:ATP synthase subunit delta n=1 Tax=Psychroflexus maritimus TaxID=2714865 RepID=A0A967E5L2_9FLAO|nr:ATP synthase F1 subunit delta [Psychroflexus maritimus]NGZ88821.1 ATP synthase F1 subunit delta [Psychroflexus maritimus]
MGKAAERYAKAFYTTTEDKNVVNEVLADMKLIKNTMLENKELKSVINSPVIDLHKKKLILEAVFSEANSNSMQLIAFLLNKKRINLLLEVASSYISIYEKNNNINRAKVVLAKELTHDMFTKIQAKVNALTGNDVEIQTEINPAILGGFVLTINDLQYDASVVGQLNKFKTQLVN